MFMNIILTILILVVLGFCIVKNVIAIVNNIKEKKNKKQVDLLDNNNLGDDKK